MQEAHTCSPFQGGTDTTQFEIKQGKAEHASTMLVCLSVASAQMLLLMSSGEKLGSSCNTWQHRRLRKSEGGL